jgi:hypothetical protein
VLFQSELAFEGVDDALNLPTTMHS